MLISSDRKRCREQQDGERSLLEKLEFICVESRSRFWVIFLKKSYLYIFREKERLSINIIRPIGPQNRSVVKCRPINSNASQFNIFALIQLTIGLTVKYLYLLRDLLTDIMDSIRCAKEQGNLVKEFLSSGIKTIKIYRQLHVKLTCT